MSASFEFVRGGSLCALVTPMRADDELCLGSLRKLVRMHIEAGTAGLVLAGTTGESPTLTADERQILLQCALEEADGRIPVIAGTGTGDTRQSIELTQAAQRLGVQACMLVVPSYSRPTQQGLYRHFSAVADETDLPVMLYNVAHRTACDLLPETVAQLASHRRIGALKESFGGERFAALSSLLADDIASGFCLYSGTDDLTLEAMQAGAQGVVSVTANLVPADIARMVKLQMQGDAPGAQLVADKLHALNTALFSEPNPIPVKWAMQRMGLIPQGIRLPLTELTDRGQRELTEVLQSLMLM